jgi:hypothetical protein
MLKEKNIRVYSSFEIELIGMGNIMKEINSYLKLD